MIGNLPLHLMRQLEGTRFPVPLYIISFIVLFVLGTGGRGNCRRPQTLFAVFLERSVRIVSYKAAIFLKVPDISRDYSVVLLVFFASQDDN